MKLKLAVDLVSGVGFPLDRQGGVNGIPFLKVSDLVRTAGGLRTAANYVEQTTLNALGARVVPAGTMLIPKIGAAIASRERRILTGAPSAYDNNILGLVPHRIDPHYLSYWLGSRDLADIVNPGALPSLDVRALGRVSIPVADAALQGAIAAFLEVECERVSKADRVASTLARKSSDAYLCRARELIVHAGYPWVLAKLVARPGTGHTPSRTHPEYWVKEECHLPWFGLADVWQIRDDATDLVEETSERISEIGLANSAAVKHPAGTLILSRTASVGFVGRMAVDMAVTQDFMTWTCGPLALPKYLLHALRACRPEIMQLVQGSTHKTIYMPDLLNIKVPLPPLDVQHRIVSELQRRIEARREASPKAAQLRATLAAYRDAVINEAVTGKLDIAASSDEVMEARLHTAAEERSAEVMV